MMKDFKFRNEDTLVFSNRRRKRRGWWLIPVLILATGGLYGAFQLDSKSEQEVAVPETKEGPLRLELELPRSKPAPAEAPVSAVVRDKIAPTPAATPVVAHLDTVRSEVAALGESVKASSELAQSGRWLEHEIASGDSLARVFKGFGLSPSLLHGLVNSSSTAKQLADIRPGQKLRIHLDEAGDFTRLLLETGPTRTLRIARSDQGFEAVWDERSAEIRSNRVSGLIESSLFASGQKAGLSDRLIMDLATIFGWDIDFALEIRAGDRFSVVFEERWLDGAKLGDGPILAAEFVNQGKTYQAVRFEDEAGRADYYSPDGKSMRKAFLRAPVDFRRISSRFTKERWHPVLGKKRPHRGVDYAAATGTPIRAAGDGKIIFRGRKGGYGHTVIVQHANKYTTLYAHMSRYHDKARQGDRVKQGQVIGYVGQSGLATGPHLHYEFRVGGVHRNPLTVKLPSAEPISEKYRTAFAEASRPLLAQLELMNQALVADAD